MGGGGVGPWRSESARSESGVGEKSSRRGIASSFVRLGRGPLGAQRMGISILSSVPGELK
jgi:hypothetical protein